MAFKLTKEQKTEKTQLLEKYEQAKDELEQAVIDVNNTIAEAVNEKGGHHLSAWSLLVEGFDPKHPPVILRAGSPELRLYEIFEAAKRDEKLPAGGDQWLGNLQTPRRRASDA